MIGMPIPGFVPYVIIGSSASASMVIDRSNVAPSSVGSARQRSTAASQSAPCGACGRPWTYSKVVSSGAMRPARAPPSMLMLQIGHPLFHRQRPDRLAAVLEDVARPAADADPGDQREDDVLGRDARREPAVDADLVGLRLALEQGLRGEDHLDLARPDPERERPERAVRRGVRVAAHDRHARLGQPELRPDDVDDALRRRADAVERDPELRAVALELADLRGGLQVEHRQVARRRRDRVIGGRHGLGRTADARPRSRRPVNACGEVTSWTRWRSTARTAGAPGSWATTWSAQILSTIVRGCGHAGAGLR